MHPKTTTHCARALVAGLGCAVLGLTGGCSADVGNVDSDLPSVTVVAPSDPASADVTIAYVLFDRSSDPVDVEVAYSVGDGGFRSATMAASGSDGATGLASGPQGVEHVFVWSSVADIPDAAQQVKIRFIVWDKDGGSTPAITGPFSVDNTSPAVRPVLSVETPQGPVSSLVSVSYTVSQIDAEPVSLDVHYSVGSGDYQPATAGPGGDGVFGLATSSDGIAHVFQWDSAADITGSESQVWLRLVVNTDGASSDPAQTGAFAVNNAIENDPPLVSVDTPNGVQHGDVVITYLLADAQGHPAAVLVELSTDGQTYGPATAGPGGDGVSNLEASPSGTAHTFVWDSGADLPGNADNVTIRITPDDGQDEGTPATSGTFSVRNAGFGAVGLKITEIDVGDADYVELHNQTAAPIDLAGHILEWTDDTHGSGAVSLPAFTLPPASRVVLREGSGASDTQNLYIGQNLGWDFDSSGSVALLDVDSNGLDFARWGGSTQAPPVWTEWVETQILQTPHGYTVLGRTGSADTNSADDFCLMPASPTADNAACLSSALGSQVRISEVSLDDPVDAVEIVNYGAAPVELTNWAVHFTSESGVSGQVLVPPYLLDPGERLVLQDDAGTPGPGVLVLGENLSWQPGDSGSAALVDAVGNGLDFVRWGGSSTQPVQPAVWNEALILPTPQIGAVTLSRDAADTDTDTDSDFCLQHEGLGTPGGLCLAAPGASSGVVINEVDCGSDDYVEVLNTGSVEVDLTMWALAWTDTATSPDLAYLPPFFLMPGERVTLREGSGAPAPGIIYLDGKNIPWDGGNTGGSAVLLDGYGNGVDFVRWGGCVEPPPSGLGWSEPTGLPSPSSGTVLGRSPDGADTDADNDFCVQPPSSGIANSPCL